MLVFQLKIALSDIIQQREEKQNKTKKEKKKIRLQIPFFAMKKNKQIISQMQTKWGFRNFTILTFWSLKVNLWWKKKPFDEIKQHVL